MSNDRINDKGGAKGGSAATAVVAARATTGGNGAKVKPPGRFAQFWDEVLEEARKDPTYRKITEEGEEKDKGVHARESARPRPRKR